MRQFPKACPTCGVLVRGRANSEVCSDRWHGIYIDGYEYFHGRYRSYVPRDAWNALFDTSNHDSGDESKSGER